MCPHLTYNGQCPGQNGCFHAHSKKMLRRRPVLQPNGKWNYWPKFCNAVSSNGGFEGFSAPAAIPCKFGESCQFAHVINEITFHPLVFKTTKCNARVGKDGYCIEKGRFCTKAHEHEALRNPNNLDDVACLFESGKAQALPPPLTGGEKLKDVDTKSQKAQSGKPKASSDNPPPPSEEHLLTQVCNSAQRDYYQYVYKTRPCKAEACRNCPNYHNPHERRRPLPPEGKVYYTSFPCEHAYDPKLGVWPEVLKCKRGDMCPMAHTKTEGIYHPDKYKTSVCQAFENGNCKWSFACAWAHGVADLNHVYIDDTKRNPTNKAPLPAPLPAPSKPLSEESPPASKWHVPPQPMRVGPGWPSLGADSDPDLPKPLLNDEPVHFHEDVQASRQAPQAQPPPYWQAQQEPEPMDNYLSSLLSDNLSSNFSDGSEESYLFHNGIAPLRAPLGVHLDSGLEPKPLGSAPCSVVNPALDLYLLDTLEPIQVSFPPCPVPVPFAFLLSFFFIHVCELHTHFT